jgi:hypothetical protein
LLRVPLVKFGCPKTRVAASPVVNGAVYRKIRWLLGSDAHRFPAESNAIEAGLFKEVAKIPPLLTVFEERFGCPKTSVAAGLLEPRLARGYIRIRALF